jgi:hypothetical protein
VSELLDTERNYNICLQKAMEVPNLNFFKIEFEIQFFENFIKTRVWPKIYYC